MDTIIASGLDLDPRHIPLSRSGSYLVVSSTWDDRRAGDGGWYLRWIGGPANSLVFRLELRLPGGAISPLSVCSVTVRPGHHRFRHPGGATLDLAMDGDDALVVEARDCGVRWTSVLGAGGYAAPLPDGAWEAVPSFDHPRFAFRAGGGSISCRTGWSYDGHRVAGDGVVLELAGGAVSTCRIAVREGGGGVPAPPGDLPTIAAAEAARFTAWSAPIDGCGEARWAASRRVAAYVLWLSTVAPRGLYREPVVMGSKNWMQRVWSWDHAFVALGLARTHPELAWKQFILFLHMQDSSGMLCDAMTPLARSWYCTKSPVHGWILGRLRRLMHVDDAMLAEVYEPLRRWTGFWLGERDLDGSGLPFLLHPNESFDGTTHTATDGPCAAPDHAAYLVLQLEQLAEIGERLGHAAEAAADRARATRLLEAMLCLQWDGHAFASRVPGGGARPPGASIFTHVPLLLGRRLPLPVITALVSGLERFRTPWGLASEALDSPLLDHGSYTRGPVWTPPQQIIAEGLDAVGHGDAAQPLRAAHLSASAVGGMSECFDARDGRPLHDPAYNWTAAGFLDLSAQRPKGGIGQVPGDR